MSDIHLFQKLPTPIGDLTLVANEIGLRAVLWPSDKDRISLPMELLASDTDTVLAKTSLQLEQYFAGERTHFDLPLESRTNKLSTVSVVFAQKHVKTISINHLVVVRAKHNELWSLTTPECPPGTKTDRDRCIDVTYPLQSRSANSSLSMHFDRIWKWQRW